MNAVATEEPHCRKYSRSRVQAAPPSLLPQGLSPTCRPASFYHHHPQPESTVLSAWESSAHWFSVQIPNIWLLCLSPRPIQSPISHCWELEVGKVDVSVHMPSRISRISTKGEMLEIFHLNTEQASTNTSLTLAKTMWIMSMKVPPTQRPSESWQIV